MISQTNVLHPGIGFIGSKSTPIFILLIGIYLSATYNLFLFIYYHPPGAAHRSTNTFEFDKKSNFLFNYTNLNAARER